MKPSFISDSWDKIDENGDVEYQESVIKATACTMYAGKYLHSLESIFSLTSSII